MSLHRELGSALIEALVIGSVSFLVIVAALSASIRIAVSGAELQEAARAGAVHAARHGDVDSARQVAAALFPGIGISALRIDDRIVVVATVLVDLPHPQGRAQAALVGRAEMPLAPFRSDRG
ncbi:MAG: hypothetical protein IH941_02085 [Acidobacteria bacterium]|nr:hypothetical protein [Acidobacteriota bacterium]